METSLAEGNVRPRSCVSATLKQILCGLIVSAGMVEVGFVVGWPAVLPALQRDNSSAFNVTNDDVKWLVSCTGIVGMVTNVFAGSLIEWVGPRLLLCLLLVPASAFWILQAFSPNLTIFIVGRIGGAFIATVFTTLTNPLLAELVEPHLRGMLSCLPEMVVASGVLIVYVLSQVLPWQIVTGICAVPFVPLFGLALVVPESPFWLVRKGNLLEAEQSIKKLRDSRGNATKDEISEIRRSILNHPQTTVMDQVRQLGVAYNAKPVILLVSIFILREFGGQYAVFSYTVYMFQRAGIDLDVLTGTILVGVVRLLSTITSALLIDRLGRRPFLIGATFGCAIAETLGGAFLLVKVPGANWVPLVAVLMFVLSYGLGVGPIPWVLLGELLPTPVRSLGASICILCFAAAQFVIGYAFPELTSAIGLGGSLLVFAVANFILGLVMFVFLPETRGRSLHELQEIFSFQPPERPLIDVSADDESNSVESR
ncbi:hypothetical protein SK128_025528 [Halocaridina rubra]|uniref:Major facilitator superfamily (MFS) profile domain-containing protein n=1 Tax=Halocaridina rubra TaxID=373956 RepID=A0AAN8X1X7_HALRR